ncbi:hypothetical protein K437DRAFT_47100 [Tilletiaria anomala UBC 951]|uniref:Uncharacterized protein n=1 Tax=Tilletiaria anomala (strain ATCC 24038 / CBS 436.72 / UBC 951) TaxID=1037660 RepID=A0A066V5K4_TILAU|nr:uncharacterized protein K437DRAFT_47100 [Tilletiaria anomala UBC 951]KDN37017.1 hypothetical protein K437DRAFT_47100 [Tilletiaria anomala UBC 951]
MELTTRLARLRPSAIQLGNDTWKTEATLGGGASSELVSAGCGSTGRRAHSWPLGKTRARRKGKKQLRNDEGRVEGDACPIGLSTDPHETRSPPLFSCRVAFPPWSGEGSRVRSRPALGEHSRPRICRIATLQPKRRETRTPSASCLPKGRR